MWLESQTCLIAGCVEIASCVNVKHIEATSIVAGFVKLHLKIAPALQGNLAIISNEPSNNHYQQVRMHVNMKKRTCDHGYALGPDGMSA